jgi:uncharacterized Zn-binding protein involved in type VI secretion
MPGISRDNDSAGGDLVPSQSSVYANDEEVIVDGDTVSGHGLFPHTPQTIVAGSNNVFVADKPVVNEGDPASVCGEPATGSSNVFVGD